MAGETILIVDDNPLNLKLVRFCSSAKVMTFGRQMTLKVAASARVADEKRVCAVGCDGYILKSIGTRALPGLIRGYLQRAPS